MNAEHVPEIGRCGVRRCYARKTKMSRQDAKTPRKPSGGKCTVDLALGPALGLRPLPRSHIKPIHSFRGFLGALAVQKV